ncbi:Kinase-like protein [Mycena indigotica]|uniref:Kinase-like protein n=1 Tax=Mycena indigotica TaxID=2126181 RepID=A0A8H6W306_9AGAR|nr:Kinase-like protein [Mycena indigotica]KAF7301021.1 Kinase-like protein [Mycena indigotica]
MSTTTGQTNRAPIYLGKFIGEGAFAFVFKGYLPSGGVVAVKKSRVSLRVKRPSLQHEARILAMVQGHRGIAQLVGYYRGPHFEYIAMELLGPPIKSQIHDDLNALAPETVARIAIQLFSALDHIHSRGIVHRDITPENILRSLENPSKICLVDFGISLPVTPISSESPIGPKNFRRPVGTLSWCSLSSHHGNAICPPDDLESTLFVLLFLLAASLPWHIPHNYGEKLSATIIRIEESKSAFVGSALEDVDCVLALRLGQILDRIRGAEIPLGVTPPYAELVAQILAVSKCTLELDQQLPLDWTPCSPPPILNQRLAHPPAMRSDEKTEAPTDPVDVKLVNDLKDSRGDKYPDSNASDYQYTWFPNYNRDRSLTLPEAQAAICDENLPACCVAPGHLSGLDEPVYSDSAQMWSFQQGYYVSHPGP